MPGHIDSGSWVSQCCFLEQRDISEALTKGLNLMKEICVCMAGEMKSVETGFNCGSFD